MQALDLCVRGRERAVELCSVKRKGRGIVEHRNDKGLER